MTAKQDHEIALVEALLIDLGLQATALQPGDRPDVLAAIGGSWVGIEVTELHPDAGAAGSQVRADEQRAARSHEVRWHWGGTDYAGAIGCQLAEKVAKAQGYTVPNGGALWLLISSQIPREGQLAATFALGEWVRLADLAALEPVLVSSPYDALFVHLICDRRVLEWRRGSGFREHDRLDPAEKQSRRDGAKAVWDVIGELKNRPLPVRIVGSFG